ncbi:flavin reductase family protein [Aspergillus affinis]|uniref:flavin reductase family protein n=1 Tax=Aspergillus affinis TaxID=1070780 RepID=UPI0022FEE109|nr:uncharacterized protein KD926_003913 [Aspergillus affinis]KAI9043383.1 hypothetical protein KD926_003913 [Aspergillus affinis]
MNLLASPRLAGRFADLSGLSCTNLRVSSFNLPRQSLCRTLSSDVTGSRTSTRCFGSSGSNNQPNTTPTETPPTPSLPDQVRLLMRRVPYPVAIITSTDPSESNNPPRAFRGMTVSSFNTVTLRPDPIISFNVRRPSETLTALQSSGRFLVHLLAADQAPASLARDFSRGNHNLSIVSGESDFEFVPHIPTLSTSESTSTSTDGAGPSSTETSNPRPSPSPLPLPLLRRKPNPETKESDSAPAPFPFVFECLLHPQNVTVGDHTIVVGKVIRALSPDSHHGGTNAETNMSFSADELCLTYANTHFWKMGTEI